MDANVIVVLECLSLGVDALHGEVCGVQGVDSQMRSAACVRRAADEPHTLCDHAVVAHPGPESVHVRGVGMREKCQIHIIELSEPNELLLSGQELQSTGGA